LNSAIFQDIPTLEAKMEGGTQAFQGEGGRRGDRGVVKMVFLVSAHDDSIGLWVGSWVSDHLKLVY
jgi:hypothetical protein